MNVIKFYCQRLELMARAESNQRLLSHRINLQLSCFSSLGRWLVDDNSAARENTNSTCAGKIKCDKQKT